MALLRDAEGHGLNSTDSVLISYDLQSGTYRSALDDPDHRAHVERYSQRIGVNTTSTRCRAGTRERAAFNTTSLGFEIASPCTRAMPRPRWTRRSGCSSTSPVVGYRAVGAFLPSLRPGALVIRRPQLARVSRRWLVQFEPSYELGSEGTRRHIEAHGYVRGMRDAAESLGLTVHRYELLPESISPVNETAVLVIHTATETPARERWLVCPRCQHELREVKGHLLCDAEGLVFPVLVGIPCLDQRNAVVASAFGHAL